MSESQENTIYIDERDIALRKMVVVQYSELIADTTIVPSFYFPNTHDFSNYSNKVKEILSQQLPHEEFVAYMKDMNFSLHLPLF